MQYEKYSKIIASADRTQFWFESKGQTGRIKKMVQFTQTLNEDIYNLAFGNRNKDGSMDDETTSNNKDRNKILATVAAIVYEFTAAHPGKKVFFRGSTPGRNRLYRIAISLNLQTLKKDFHIYGILKGANGFKTVNFRKNTEYFAFLVKRKRVNLIYETISKT